MRYLSMLKRELCEIHAQQIRSKEFFGRKPREEAMEENSTVTCGIETMQLYGKRTSKRIHNCSNRATVRFGFGQILPDERLTQN